MKQIVQQLTSYNAWANQQMAGIINALPAEYHNREIPSSFNSLFKTILHMYDAESIWWQRMRLSEKVIRPSEDFFGDMKDATAGLLGQSLQWKEWAIAAQEHMFSHEFIYLNTKKDQFKQPVYEVIVQICNHGTYHRGQLVTMLRQLGVEKIPQTDFIVYCRKK